MSSFEEFTTCVESHPHLPIYVCGHNKGLLSLYRYAGDSISLKKAAEFMTSPNIQMISNKASQLKKVKFNAYGDKFASNDHDGNMYIFRLDKMYIVN